MIPITTEENQTLIVQRMNQIERTITNGFRLLDSRLATVESVFQFFNDGLEAYRGRLLKESHFSRIRNQYLERMRADKELRFPHRKILDFLLGDYDYSKQEFKEVQFSRLAREARIGKSMAKSYLSLLEQKGLIIRRDDGYRIFFRIRSQLQPI